MVFVGLDLAWSEANPSGAVALGWDGLRARPLLWESGLGEDPEILAFVEEAGGTGPALLAVDAPLLVPNETGTRPCDRELSRAYRWAQAQAYPANRRRLGPQVRGEALVRALEKRGFVHSPCVEKRGEVRQVVEVFPHPATIELFGLPNILRYKARPGRSQELRWRELQRFRELLFGLACAEPAMEGEAILGSAEPWGKRGKELKNLEDLLDALFCAYIGLHLWYWGPAGYRLFGDENEGYILVPVRPKAG